MKTRTFALWSLALVLVALLLILSLTSVMPAATRARADAPFPKAGSMTWELSNAPGSAVKLSALSGDTRSAIGAQTSTFGPKNVIASDAAGAYDVHAADLDGDGDVDVLSASRDDNKVAWYENDGGSPPAFTPHIITTAAAWPIEVHAADMNGDGDVDVVSGSYDGRRVDWYENDGAIDPTFAAHPVAANAGSVKSIHAADLDGDGDTDVLSAGPHDSRIVLWHENSGGPLPTFTQHTVGSSGVWASSIYAADLDGDSDLDVITGVDGWNRIYWYENSGAPSPGFTQRTVDPDINAPQSVYAADLDGDGDVDVVSAAQNAHLIAWHENIGGSPPTFVERAITTNAQYAWSVFAADLDLDGDIDVLSASWLDNKIAWYENDGASPPTFIAHDITTSAMHAFAVHAADVDGDGDPDVLSASYDDDTIAWYENLGTPPDPAILSLEPTFGYQGETLDVAIIGRNTHWDNTTLVDLGTGITATLTVTDVTHAVAHIVIDSNAPKGFHAITLTTGTEVATKEDAFIVGDARALRACPADLAGSLAISGGVTPTAASDFQWYEYFGGQTFAPTETLKLAFSIVPFGSGKTLVGLDEIGGRSGYSLYFENGLVNGAVPYTSDAWNQVEVVFDFGTKHYTLTVNGV